MLVVFNLVRVAIALVVVFLAQKSYELSEFFQQIFVGAIEQSRTVIIVGRHDVSKWHEVV